MEIDAFTRAYIECALWSSTDESREDGGDPLDRNYGRCDIAPETLARMVADCAAFQEANADTLAHAGDSEQNGHDFWLTRNGHGAGFWDRGYSFCVDGVNVGDALSDASKVYGSFDLYVSDEGMIYGS